MFSYMIDWRLSHIDDRKRAQHAQVHIMFVYMCYCVCTVVCMCIYSRMLCKSLPVTYVDTMLPKVCSATVLHICIVLTMSTRNLHLLTNMFCEKHTSAPCVTIVFPTPPYVPKTLAYIHLSLSLSEDLVLVC